MGIGDVRNRPFGQTGRSGMLRGRAPAWLAVPALALLLAGCAGAGIGGGNGNEGPMGAGDAGDQGFLGSSMQTTTVAPTAAGGGTSGAGTAAVTPGAPDPSEFTCPPIQVRTGAAAWQVTEPSDGGVRYQATLGQFSRECRFSAPDMNMRIGIQGRVLLGPKGGPGKLTVPLRLAVVEEGPAPKSVWTKFYSVPVEVGPGVMQVDFGLVADDVNFPRPSPGASESYVVFVGFDPQGKEEKPTRARPAAPRTQPQAQQAPRQTPAAARPAPVATPAPTATPRQTSPAVVPAASAAPRTAPAAPSTTVQSAPATPAPAATAPAATAPSAAAPTRTITPAPAASAPAPAPDNSQTQWIGAPAPSTGGFAQ